MKKFLNLFLITLTIILVNLMSNDLFACAVCNDMGNESPAYMWATGFLLLLPFVLIGGIFYWVYKKHKNNAEEIQK